MPRRPEPLVVRRTAVFAGVCCAMLLAAGCSAPAPAPAPTASVSETATAAPEPEPSPTSTDPVLHPNGTAEENLPLFTSIVQAVWSTPQQVEGRAYIDALVAGGFDKTAMQVTPDQSTVGNPAETIQFSVHWGPKCLVGQVGPATGQPFTTIVPALDGGGCLIGRTRPIDW